MSHDADVIFHTKVTMLLLVMHILYMILTSCCTALSSSVTLMAHVITTSYVTLTSHECYTSTLTSSHHDTRVSHVTLMTHATLVTWHANVTIWHHVKLCQIVMWTSHVTLISWHVTMSHMSQITYMSHAKLTWRQCCQTSHKSHIQNVFVMSQFTRSTYRTRTTWT